MYMNGYGIIGLISLLCAIWVIYDVLTNQKSYSSERKILWVIAAIIFSIPAAIIYYFVEKKRV